MNRNISEEFEEFVGRAIAPEALVTSGKSKNLEDFPLMFTYFSETGVFPSVLDYTDSRIFPKATTSFLKKNKCESIFYRETFSASDKKFMQTSGTYKIKKGYYAIISLEAINSSDFEETKHDIKKFVEINAFQFIVPPNGHVLKDLDLEKTIRKFISKNSLTFNDGDPSIAMICHDDGDFYTKDFYIKEKYDLVHADLHYGKGFIEFHTALLMRLQTEKKGLILFHGEPGTGKTYYIRHLLRELLERKKYIIYIPPSVVEHLANPEMISFISETVLTQSESGKTCVLLIEDAEPLLLSRDLEMRSSGITNLLNITDGIMNDMFNIQVICTFNTELKRIDKALLRPERLIARKEFQRLKKSDVQELANLLKITKPIESDMTLAELYAQLKSNEILIHDYNDGKGNIGFRK